ncbi:MAG TPA: SDR family NAD(P)-dependent oxidoreductase [Acidimicrobiales bacterium]
MERRVLVTGSNSGIGLQVALQLARDGFRVIGSARDPAATEAVHKAAAEAGVTIDTEVLDVTDPAAAERVVPGLALWGLVNNAGYIEAGTVVDVEPDAVRRQFETLVFGPMRLAQLAIPGMRRRGEGRIVNVTSAVAHAGGALLGWYTAAKQALTAATEALRVEVAAWGIDVMAVEPGATRTPIWDGAAALLRQRAQTSLTPRAYARGQQLIDAALPRLGDPGQVAVVVSGALRAGRPRAVYRVGADAALMRAAARLIPTAAKDRLTSGALRLKGD